MHVYLIVVRIYLLFRNCYRVIFAFYLFFYFISILSMSFLLEGLKASYFGLIFDPEWPKIGPPQGPSTGQNSEPAVEAQLPGTTQAHVCCLLCIAA